MLKGVSAVLADQARASGALLDAGLSALLMSRMSGKGLYSLALRHVMQLAWQLHTFESKCCYVMLLSISSITACQCMPAVLQLRMQAKAWQQ
jgi:hypothetical protein